MAVKRCRRCGCPVIVAHRYGDPELVDDGCPLCELEADEDEGAWAIGPDGGDAERVDPDDAHG